MSLSLIHRPLIMGILNITEDSFSDGGRYLQSGAAVQHALKMLQEGADIIDVGGESTRPGSSTIPAAIQIERVVPVIREINSAVDGRIKISIDTTLSSVAAAALDAGASFINDISAGRGDGNMFQLAANRNVPIILMHMQGTPATMQEHPEYTNVVEEVRDFLLERAHLAEASGVRSENIIIDPGIGFGKTKQHNLELLAHLERFVAAGYPVLLGASRKRFMGSLCEVTTSDALAGATCATTVLGVLAGVKIFRVHDVMANRQALDVTLAIENAGS